MHRPHSVLRWTHVVITRQVACDPERCVYPFLTGLRWLVATRASFSGGLWTRQLSPRRPAQHAVDHYINGEAKPLVDISSDQLSGVGSN